MPAAGVRLTGPRTRAAVERLAKAVRHVKSPPRVPVYLGLARIADQAEHDLAGALQGAWEDALDGLNVRAAYEAGRVETVTRAVADAVRDRVERMANRSLLRTRIRAAEFISGTTAAGVAKRFPQMDFFHRLLRSLDWFMLNPRMVTAALTHATRLAEVERQETVQAIRRAVVQGLEQGLPYDEASALIEGSVGLNGRQQQTLGRLSATLREHGVAGDEYDAALAEYAERARAYRAEMIARTEGQAASNGGAYDTYQEGKRQGLLEADLVKEWIASNDACPICAPANGQQRRIDEPFVLNDGAIVVNHPPAHPNCRCKFGMAEPTGKAEPTARDADTPLDRAERVYPKAGATVDGRTVGRTVSNRDSIGASLEEWEELGIRAVPMDAFEDRGKPTFTSRAERERVEALAAEIRASGRIDPLIVVQDEKGPYVLEGGHRYDALRLLDAKEFPALVVVDTEVSSKPAPGPAAKPTLTRPEPTTPSPEGFQYHATTAERAEEIAHSGLRPHRPSFGTEQDVWPDGKRERRSYFNPNASTVWQFAPEEGRPVMIRAAQDAAPFRKEGTGDTYLTKPLPASALEILTDQGWRPLRDVFPE